MLFVKKLSISLFGLCVLGVAFPAQAQDPKLQVSGLDQLAARAVESVEVSLNEAQLEFVRKLARLDRYDRTRQAEQLAKLSSVYVRMFEFAQDGELGMAEVEPIRAQLRAPGWERFPDLATGDGRNHDAFIMQRNGEIVGYASIYSDARKLCVINITGRMTHEDVREFNLSDCKGWSRDHTGRRSR